MELYLNLRCVTMGRKYTTSIVEKLPPIAARVPTYGYQMASKNGPIRMRKFIIMLILREDASCLPVTMRRIWERSRAIIRALTQTSCAKAQNRMNVAILLVTVNISRSF